MKPIKPRLFIGSSSESKETARAFAAALSDVATPVVWWTADEFVLATNTMEALLGACRYYDFGLFIMAGDDKADTREEEVLLPRDNVTFEFGMFMGALGRERGMAVLEMETGAKAKVKLPSDLLGENIARYPTRQGQDFQAEIDRAAQRPRERIRSMGRRHGWFGLLRGFSLVDANHKFTGTIALTNLLEHMRFLRGKRVFLAARRYDTAIDFDEDGKLAIGIPRLIPDNPVDDIHLEVPIEGRVNTLREGDKVEAAVLIMLGTEIPSGTETLRQLKQACLMADWIRRPVV
jgi:hypothetical protein